MVILAITLPVALVAILGSRDFSPYGTVLPTEVTGQLREWSPVGSWTDLQGSLTGRIRWVEDESSLGLDLELGQDLDHPDVLAYWSRSATGEEPSGLASDAWLLGAIKRRDDSPLQIPAGLELRSGRLVLYSLGSGEVVAWATPEMP